MPSTFQAHDFTKLAFLKVTCDSELSKPVAVLSLSPVMVHWPTSLPRQLLAPSVSFAGSSSSSYTLADRSTNLLQRIYLSSSLISNSACPHSNLPSAPSQLPFPTCPSSVNNFLWVTWGSELSLTYFLSVSNFSHQFSLLFPQKVSLVSKSFEQTIHMRSNANIK